MEEFTIAGNIVDIVQRRIYPGTLKIKDATIVQIQLEPSTVYDRYIIPGFVDAHVHIESSMLVPSEFARYAVIHGTVATVSDPHEIGNVLGIDGVRYMIHNGSYVPFHFCFGAPSCVPATRFETAGAEITAEDIEKLFVEDGLSYLSEVMNYPGVLHRDPEVMRKIEIAQRLGKRIDGHAPGLRGEEAKQYAAAGIETDHECFSYEEAVDKIRAGMKILIREGSAAKNYDALIPLVEKYADKLMFCSDDKHPDDLLRGHINTLVRRTVKEHNVHPITALQIATLHPVQHYGLDVGLLQIGDPADFLIVDDLYEFNVLATYIRGRKVAENGKTLLPHIEAETVNNFAAHPIQPEALQVPATCEHIRVIEAIDGELITRENIVPAPIKKGLIVSDPKNDILKIVVVNRYADAPPAIGFIRNFGLKRGAIASSVAHDSHNIVAVGVRDEEIANAINAIIEHRGGIATALQDHTEVLPLPVAGLMATDDGETVAKRYSSMDKFARQTLGSSLQAPFMTLSFMALLVIPSLKLSDQGLFNGDQFSFVKLCVET